MLLTTGSVVLRARLGRARGVEGLVGSAGVPGSTDGVAGASTGAKPIACSNEGGGDLGRSMAVPFWGGGAVVELASNAGGNLLVDGVGKGNAGGGSDDSGRSATSALVSFNEKDTDIPSQTFVRLMLAPLATPSALPSSLELTVGRLDGPASVLTTRLRRLAPAGACSAGDSAIGGVEIGSVSKMCPSCPNDIILLFTCPNSRSLSSLRRLVPIPALVVVTTTGPGDGVDPPTPTRSAERRRGFCGAGLIRP